MCRRILQQKAWRTPASKSQILKASRGKKKCCSGIFLEHCSSYRESTIMARAAGWADTNYPSLKMLIFPQIPNQKSIVIWADPCQSAPCLTRRSSPSFKLRFYDHGNICKRRARRGWSLGHFPGSSFSLAAFVEARMPSRTQIPCRGKKKTHVAWQQMAAAATMCHAGAPRTYYTTVCKLPRSCFSPLTWPCRFPN